MSLSIRRADSLDAPFLLQDLKQFSDFYASKYPLFPSDDNTALKTIEGIIDKGIFLIGEVDNEIVGFIAGYLGPHIFNPEIMVLSELFWWVKPKHRSSTVGSRLLEQYTKIGKENANWITMVLEKNSPVPDSYLKQKGFVENERSFIMEVM